ncbi:MAG: Fic family protein [Rhodospirillales bacterium]|jgi:Fic family protein|nr:Fic family protein [Rhodospirillales bacterium]MBT4040958.1 Fic family protein [Rhodospirillales bacterium]MBT4625640.1 Fic family protein [Rhodospirillales bacterium]MBT5350191.1 Fic family protein [Rhodospirillales bacterium]MBT5522027.1 Fic family protein [Rhodospirillales bacterium]
MANFDPKLPYNALPDLPPHADIESKAILKKCILARAALAELKQAGELIPNQNVLINTIPLREAQGSSQIENIITTTDRLYEFAATESQAMDANTKEAFRYRTALYQGYKDAHRHPISTRTAVQVCRTIKGVEMEIRATPGTALRNDATGDIIYTPPEGQDRLHNQLGNWERFIHNETEVDPLIRMAIAHYQFEAIHPFTDGNGRTGRILNILYLIGEGLLEIPVLYLSRHIIENKDDYYRLLMEVTAKNNWEEWIIYMLSAIEETAKWTTNKIRGVRNLMGSANEFVHQAAPGVFRQELVELTFVQPYCRISDLVDAGIAERRTASKYLKILSDIGYLHPAKIGRDKLFINTRFLALLMDEENDYEFPRPG